MNELAKIFNAMGIDTHDVIEAAASKWNFIKLNPGLVGGHCISVDPYYLIQKAQVYGVLPRIMFSARRLNDGMGAYVANRTIKSNESERSESERCEYTHSWSDLQGKLPDIRNTKIVDIYHTLKEYTSNITIFDPWANPEAVKHEYGIEITQNCIDALHGKFDAVILGVAHKQFTEINVRDFLTDYSNGVVYDVKGILPREVVDARL